MNAPIVLTPDRTKFIGGSDASVVLGINPWRTPLQLWQDKTTPRVEEVSPEKRKLFARGHRMEPYVCDLLAEETGLVLARRNARYIDAEFPFIAAEIDAEAESGENIEIKTVSPFKAMDWGELGSDAIPVYYTAQAQHGMMVRPAPVCVFGVLIGGDDFRIYRVERDDEIITALRAREVAFWRDHVEANVPPEPVNAEDVARLFPKDLGTAIEANAGALIAFNELRGLKLEATLTKKRIEVLQEQIECFMGGASRLVTNGLELATWKTQSARRFDQAAFKESEPELFESFVKSSEHRVFRIK